MPLAQMLAWANTYIANLGPRYEIEVPSFRQVASLSDRFCDLVGDHQPHHFLRFVMI